MPAILFLIAAMSFTGANVPFGKIVVESVSVYHVLLFRFTVAACALLCVTGRPGIRRLVGLQRRDWLDIAVLAGVGSVLFTVFLLEGTRRTSAVDAGIITATLPAAVAILSVVVLRHVLSRAAMICVALAAVGLIVMQAGSADVGAASLTGNGLVAMAVLCEATFVLVSRRVSARLRPTDLSLAVSVLSAAMALPFALPGLSLSVAVETPLWVWLLATWYALSASVFCTVLWYAGVGRVPPWQAGLATAALPVTAMVVSVMVLNESLSAFQIVGAVLVIGAICAGALIPARSETPNRAHRMRENPNDRGL
ncbi:MAG: DMT family transporter [Pseudomonadota bacterium]